MSTLSARARGLGGFTLIELLVAIVVMSMLALLSWRSIDGMTRTQTLTQQHADDLLRLQATLGQWNADLDAVFDTGEINALDFDGRVLRLTRRDASETGLVSPGMRVVAWARISGGAGPAHWSRWQSGSIQRRDQLARAWQRASEWGREAQGSEAASSEDSSVALIPIAKWQLFYHRGETWGNPQSAVGNEDGAVANESQLPNGIRVVLSLAPGHSLSGELVRDWVRTTLEAGR
ncbi:MAG TPA: prepilin-type N-terminal cleavage/methylation domain-containing protein [Hydrogenophaga sp.]|nr:prepilin-type N-terminal cleavage/methylation domain-containing protein [Hydrogenophaga sp.]